MRVKRRIIRIKLTCLGWVADLPGIWLEEVSSVRERAVGGDDGSRFNHAVDPFLNAENRTRFSQFKVQIGGDNDPRGGEKSSAGD